MIVFFLRWVNYNHYVKNCFKMTVNQWTVNRSVNFIGVIKFYVTTSFLIIPVVPVILSSKRPQIRADLDDLNDSLGEFYWFSLFVISKTVDNRPTNILSLSNFLHISLDICRRGKSEMYLSLTNSEPGLVLILTKRYTTGLLGIILLLLL